LLRKWTSVSEDLKSRDANLNNASLIGLGPLNTIAGTDSAYHPAVRFAGGVLLSPNSLSICCGSEERSGAQPSQSSSLKGLIESGWVFILDSCMLNWGLW